MNWRATTRRLLPYLVVAAGGFLLAYLIVAFFIFPAGVVPDDAVVPNVTGMLFDDAVAQLRKTGFKGKQGEMRAHSDAPRLTVLDETPPAGTRTIRGTTVVLAVSAGQQMGTVPTLSGMTRAQAESTLERSGFNVGEIQQQPSGQPRGMVIDSHPAGGQQAPLPGPVSLVLSMGPASVAVPDLVGKTYPQGRSILEQLGLHIGVVTIDSAAAVPANTITSQTPAAGASVAAGGGVSLTISGRTP